MAIIPQPLQRTLAGILGAEPTHIRAWGGGFLAGARFQAGAQEFLVKWHNSAAGIPPGWPTPCQAEGRGLALLAATQTLRVPHVVSFDGSGPDNLSYVVMEWIETASGADGSRAGEALGRALAAQHRHSAPAYGLDHNNYCGATPQDNRPLASWLAFYGERRLGFQLDLAARGGLLDGSRRHRLESLIANLGRWIDDGSVQPALLHGDLWGGNWLIDAQGAPVLIDPAVYYGDREAELAMCRLFGGFPDAFYRAYDEAWPPAAGRDERVALYQLYHLLNHLNLFGEGYGRRVEAVLRHYA